ncbi:MULTISPECIES: ABC transporter ATP-binding protein [unclassified Clostridium]|jgi:ABC-transporter ATP-binding protein, iron(III)|uniref:ABC transporter ATP-binding protein n=1 Tax=unclassified Clostridium TaxID=2614128 RepID=UPI0025BCD739|nr:ATP-binding cassette domain-containing protein [Clostridium sp.]MCI6693818.1 ATP-binding cassette domain-containing protein [Clostridium sp.]MDY2630638.1 ATP-binding cassette domain-containing protein [Clostridium sp.]MDY4251433.1 ATP-binding cassette domain-containing protein [Clostridium sp.]MDY6228104.1 ATP-binding cassette domain-containing protein [Clostridium sp.]
MSYITLKNIEKYFGKSKVLDNINIDIEKGEFVSLLGPSGCGKTTLLRIISGLESKNSGEIYVDGKEISKVSPAKRNIGIVFQNYVLFPNLTVYENIAYGLVNKKVKKEEIEKKVNNILDKIDLKHIKHKYPKQLSGGQQQRVALARAVVLSPKILLLDEPLSALDAKVRETLRKEIKALQKDLGITTIMVTHDQEEALTMSDKIVVINEGEIMQIGAPEEVYKNPANNFTADFIGAINIVEVNNKIKIVRPEDILISDKKLEDYKKCVVKDLEFRGAFYRLTIKTEADEEITVDILAHSKEQYNIEKNREIYYKIG